MKRFPLMAAATVFGLALLAGATQQLAAVGPKPMLPADGQRCYYHLWSCSYVNGAYWSGCDPEFMEGYIPTETARAICSQYHGQ